MSKQRRLPKRKSSFGQDGVLRFTKCDVFLLAHSTYGGVDKIFNMRILLSALQKELI